MTISYTTDELLSKNLDSRLQAVSRSAQPPKPKKPKAVKSTNGKTRGPGTVPKKPKTAAPAPMAQKPPAAPTPPGYGAPAAPTAPKPMATPAPANPGLPGYTPNPVPLKSVQKSYTVEEIEKVGLGAIGGMIAGGLGRAKAAMPRMKRAGATALGPDRTKKVKTLGSKMAGSSIGGAVSNRYSNVSPSINKWNKKLIARDAGIATAGTAAIGGTGYMLAKAEQTEDEKRLRDIKVGTASNIFGAGMGAIATGQALKQGKANFNDYEKQTKHGKKTGEKPQYRPQTKAGRAIHRHLPKGLKNNKYAIPALILGGASAGAAGQAANGLMDANSARVFVNEERSLKRKMASEEGIVKAVEVPIGNGHGTNLSPWYGSNPDAAEIGFTSVGKAIRHTSDIRDEAAEKKRRQRNAVAVTSAAAGAATAGYQGAKTVGDYRKYQRSTKLYGGMQDGKGAKTSMRLRDVAGFGNAKQKIADDAGSRQTLSSLYGKDQWQNKSEFDGYRDSRGRQVSSKLVESSGDGAEVADLDNKSRSEHFKDVVRPKRRKKIKDARAGALRAARAKMGGRAALAAGGVGLAYAGYKAKTD